MNEGFLIIESMVISKNDIVEHPIKKEWGISRVLEISEKTNRIKIFFKNIGLKELALNKAPLRIITDERINDIFLNNLSNNIKKNSHNYKKIDELTNLFLKKFPYGFNDDAFIEGERKYKINAHNLFNKILEQNKFRLLLSNEKFTEIVTKALKVVNATNLIYRNEKMDLNEGLKSIKSKEEFSYSLFYLLYSDREIKSRFQDFAIMLKNIGANYWTIQTYFLFIKYKEQYLFMKPSVTQDAAKVCNFELNYKSNLNWYTYDSLLKFGNYLKSELSCRDKNLVANDMIDIQTFLWSIAQ